MAVARKRDEESAGGTVVPLKNPRAHENRKLTLMIGRTTQDDLLEITRRKAVSISDAVRRAIRVYAMLVKASDEGATVKIISADQMVVREVILI